VRVWHALSFYSINPWRPAVNTHERIGGSLRQPILWLVGGLLIGIGFVGAFSGGLLFLLVGAVVLVVTARRYRGHLRGWSAALYATGASIALFLSPYVFKGSRCVHRTDSGCYHAFTLAVFAAAVFLALVGLVLGVLELRRWRRSASG
jgi:asparagine N-glycosylation enzyme membrane subunit Stt3